ncbi:hypothetical protein C2U68_17265 [Methylomonas koyamae]|nr:hypothetical protein C2U68_17265 [Methylomonas koyamae]
MPPVTNVDFGSPRPCAMFWLAVLALTAGASGVLAICGGGDAGGGAAGAEPPPPIKQPSVIGNAPKRYILIIVFCRGFCSIHCADRNCGERRRHCRAGRDVSC